MGKHRLLSGCLSGAFLRLPPSHCPQEHRQPLRTNGLDGRKQRADGLREYVLLPSGVYGTLGTPTPETSPVDSFLPRVGQTAEVAFGYLVVKESAQTEL